VVSQTNKSEGKQKLYKKLDPRGLRQLRVFWLKKKIFSRRSTKFSNPRPIHTQGAKLRERVVS
jgi:hypothetical protein